ncbi:MAG: YihY/virulence factor BrkB family protein, partial [Bacteroidia bacterium]|nr:YihY/virulence factor BrkB family protein [Bacteroidia bacterium]
FGPANRKKWRFISAGGTLATILIVATSMGFSYFIENFGAYNKIYGSISTLIIILLFVYINSLQLIIGFELNAAIDTAKQEAKEFEDVTEEMEKRNTEF